MSGLSMRAAMIAVAACALGCVSGQPTTAVALGDSVSPSALPTRAIDGTPLVAGTAATVYYFAGPECPIARAYSPDVARNVERDGGRGIYWVMVFPEDDITTEMVREFQRDYSLPIPAVIEGSVDLCCTLGVTAIPSVAVIGADGRLLYRGRIDNRYKGLGTTYGPPTKRDLEEVTNAIAAGTPLPPASTTAVGCVLAPCGTAHR